MSRLRDLSMWKPPSVADLPPSDPSLTRYDEEHLVTYLRMLDANAKGADWREVSRIVLHIDAERETDRARRAMTVTSHAPDGSRRSDTGSCFHRIGGRTTALTSRAHIRSAVPRDSFSAKSLHDRLDGSGALLGLHASVNPSSEEWTKMIVVRDPV